MKLSLFLLLCLNGLALVARSTLSTIHHKYHLIMEKRLWSEAQIYCRETYTDLATIVTGDDWLQLNKEATGKGYQGPAWIGLYNDADSWRWTLNDLLLKDATYTNWYPGSPNSNTGNEACGAIFIVRAWGDNLCSTLLPFICYNSNFSGSDKFIWIATPLSWPEAQSYCQTHHTDLASSLNSSDDNLLGSLVTTYHSNAWFGLYRDTWKWSDGTVVTNLTWASGEPNNFNEKENCASHNINFSNEICGLLQYFYCHTIPPVRERQMIRLQVKSDGSVFAPATQAFILEQIKKQLEEKGMLENSTVAWRVQPGGNIFHKKSKADV